MSTFEPIASLARDLSGLHDAFEKSDLIMPRLSSREGYAAVLRGMRAVHIAVEPALARYARTFAEYGVDVAQRAKMHLLDAELMDLPSAGNFGEHSVRVKLTTPACAWGWLYVLEGSTLGGAYLAKEVRRSLDVTPKYYGCYGSDTLPMWMAFGAGLNRFVAATPGVFPEILLGARECYGAFALALAQH